MIGNPSWADQYGVFVVMIVIGIIMLAWAIES